MSSGIIEIDLHGKRVEEALKAVKREVGGASGSVYIIRVIHGYHGGTAIREAIWDEFSYGRNPKVLRIKQGINPGITELILREI
ncbi:MAG: Smr/MutS family protein [Lachnospiraceae bacterium]|nr:Smr/MutS family protein [Lachnospiraceae bacterium]